MNATKGSKIETVEDAVLVGIQKAAPFYEAWPILERWLYDNGISLGNGGSFWRAMDQRPKYQGIMFSQVFNNLSEALTFALEHVKLHLQENVNPVNPGGEPLTPMPDYDVLFSPTDKP